MKDVVIVVLATLVLLFLATVIIMEDNYNKIYAERGNPLYISDLEKGKIYTRPDKHLNIVLFITEDDATKVAFLSEDCPQRFMVVDDNGTLRTVPVPPVEK